MILFLVVALGSVCQVLSGTGFALVVSPLVMVTLQISVLQRSIFEISTAQ